MTAIISRSRRAATGFVTSIEDTKHPAAICDPTDGRYAVMCEEHGEIVNVESKDMALHCARYSTEFCDGCREAFPQGLTVQAHAPAAAQRQTRGYDMEFVRGIFDYAFDSFSADAHEIADRFNGDHRAALKCLRWMERKGYLVSTEVNDGDTVFQSPMTYDNGTLEEARAHVGL